MILGAHAAHLILWCAKWVAILSLTVSFVIGILLIRFAARTGRFRPHERLRRR